MTTNRALADRYAEAKLRADAANAELEALRKEILATGQETIVGDEHTVTVALSERTTVSAGEAKKILTAEQFKSIAKTALVTTLRVKEVLSAIAA